MIVRIVLSGMVLTGCLHLGTLSKDARVMCSETGVRSVKLESITSSMDKLEVSCLEKGDQE